MMLTSIYHNVPVLRQPKPKSCWFTAMQMVTRWARAVGKSPGLKDPADDPVLKGLYMLDWGLPFADSERSAKRLGYNSYSQSPNLNGLHELLLYSPVLYAGEWTSQAGDTNTAGHWVVITGLAESRISVNDPMYGRMFYEWSAFFGGDLQLTAEQPLYYPK
jgi:hypothetical protein